MTRTNIDQFTDSTISYRTVSNLNTFNTHEVRHGQQHQTQRLCGALKSHLRSSYQKQVG